MMLVGKDEAGNVLILDSDSKFAASRVNGVWRKGVHFTPEALFERGDFADVEPDEAAALRAEAEIGIL